MTVVPGPERAESQEAGGGWDGWSWEYKKEQSQGSLNDHPGSQEADSCQGSPETSFRRLMSTNCTSLLALFKRGLPEYFCYSLGTFGSFSLYMSVHGSLISGINNHWGSECGHSGQPHWQQSWQVFASPLSSWHSSMSPKPTLMPASPCPLDNVLWSCCPIHFFSLIAFEMILIFVYLFTISPFLHQERDPICVVHCCIPTAYSTA